MFVDVSRALDAQMRSMMSLRSSSRKNVRVFDSGLSNAEMLRHEPSLRRFREPDYQQTSIENVSIGALPPMLLDNAP